MFFPLMCRFMSDPSSSHKSTHCHWNTWSLLTGNYYVKTDAITQFREVSPSFHKQGWSKWVRRKSSSTAQHNCNDYDEDNNAGLIKSSLSLEQLATDQQYFIRTYREILLFRGSPTPTSSIRNKSPPISDWRLWFTNSLSRTHFTLWMGESHSLLVKINTHNLALASSPAHVRSSSSSSSGSFDFLFSFCTEDGAKSVQRDIFFSHRFPCKSS